MYEKGKKRNEYSYSFNYRNQRVGASRRRQTEVAAVSRYTSNKRPTCSYEKGEKFRIKQRLPSKLNVAHHRRDLSAPWNDIRLGRKFDGTLLICKS